MGEAGRPQGPPRQRSSPTRTALLEVEKGARCPSPRDSRRKLLRSVCVRRASGARSPPQRFASRPLLECLAPARGCLRWGLGRAPRQGCGRASRGPRSLSFFALNQALDRPQPMAAEPTPAGPRVRSLAHVPNGSSTGFPGPGCGAGWHGPGAARRRVRRGAKSCPARQSCRRGDLSKARWTTPAPQPDVPARAAGSPVAGLASAPGQRGPQALLPRIPASRTAVPVDHPEEASIDGLATDSFLNYPHFK